MFLALFFSADMHNSHVIGELPQAQVGEVSFIVYLARF
jgi:hypothetical protein